MGNVVRNKDTSVSAFWSVIARPAALLHLCMKLLRVHLYCSSAYILIAVYRAWFWAIVLMNE